MNYPFEKFKAAPGDQARFERHLPHVSQAMVEFFRTAAIAEQSVQQRNMFGGPQGIRRDLGFDDSLKLLLIACYNDRLIAPGIAPMALADLVRQLALRWYSFGHSLDAALFVAYYLFTQQSQAIYTLRDLKNQVEFVSNASTAHIHDEVAPLMTPLYSHHWFKTPQGMGDKLSNIYIAEGDFTKVDLPTPGIQVHFKKSQAYDLRAPLFMQVDWLEEPVVAQGKVTASCPTCGQKCRGPAFRFLEITCPNCRTVWQLGT